ncbi:MAG: cobyric acid synthase [Candidatus Rokubacteria bacterium]|nr:cobyric acid synthase [Candidatus Rokubacteria bacterium]
MALNAYVTRDGGEMGWAQAMQAEAAGLEPRVEMNPILLKPQSEQGSQVVLLGKVLGKADAQEYFGMTGRLWPAVVESYRRLAAEADFVLIEGAGNPAEPNLMDRDIANMAVARLAGAPVLLLGDIDRGGVFGSLLGTLALLPPADRRRVKGFILNKFRGDPALLAPAVDFLERKSRRRVVGVVPMLPRLHLPEEDSVALEQSGGDREGEPRRVTIAVVALPHIANFTDFAPLELEPRARVVYARRPADLARADLVILPGTKDTIADLRFLKAEGFDRALGDHRERGGAVGGICGGFQMLGRSVADPHGVERGGEEPGLGLLPVTTVLEPPKITRRVVARLLPGPWGEGPAKGGVNEEWEAYEIHMGRTLSDGTLAPLFAVRREGRGTMEEAEGLVTQDGRVWGTYLHGCLDAPAVRDRLLTGLERRPLRPSSAPSPDYREAREAAYDALADALRRSLDLAAIRSLIGL